MNVPEVLSVRTFSHLHLSFRDDARATFALRKKQTKHECVSNCTDINVRPFYAAAFGGSKASQPASSLGGPFIDLFASRSMGMHSRLCRQS